MIAIMGHRGPDDQGVYLSPDGLAGLGNCRLSIIDLSPAAHMPMGNEDGSVWITYNGEIYNFPALRKELLSRGHAFRSRADTEVILHGYEEWGVEIFRRLNGMFALALWDEGQQRLVLARDRLGIKPLYYCPLGGRLLFGSEIKSLLVWPEVPRELAWRNLPSYLAYLWVGSPQTMFQGIYKLPPAHYLVWQKGQTSTHRYWLPPMEVDNSLSEAQSMEEFRWLLGESVRRHLISDVPLGLLLSGGLDSSSVLAFAAAASSRPVTVYTIGYRQEDAAEEQSGQTDLTYARLAARAFGADYHEIILSPQAAWLLPDLIWHMDEPVADGAIISSYVICREARPHLKVLLCGHGADEFLAGYSLHQAYRWAELARRVPPRMRRSLFQPLLNLLLKLRNNLGPVHPGLISAIYRFASKALTGADLSREELYLKYRAFGVNGEGLPQILASDLRASLQDQDSSELQHKLFLSLPPDLDSLNRILLVDALTYMPELNLTYMDKTSSAASVEMRVPFLDVQLVEYMCRLPAALKLRGSQGKFILRQAMQGILPEAILKRRKAPFASPMRRWLRHDLRGMVQDILSPATLKRKGIFDPVQVEKLIHEHQTGGQDHMHAILAVLTFELWHQTFIEGKPRFTQFASNG
jgi:asparagine synthase (glutamine-hydrolysing)